MGQIGSAMGNPNTGAPDPSGFSGSEWATRFLGAGAKGLGQGLQNQQQQNSMMQNRPSAPTPIPMAQQPQVSLPTQGVSMGPGTGDPSSTKARNPYFFGYGQ